MKWKIFVVFLDLLLISLCGRTGHASELFHWNIEGIDREAAIVTPAHPSNDKLALLFVFHGHGGSMRSAERGQAFHESWPEALVIYPQGLPTAGFLGDSRGMLPAWQHNPAENGDRDLKFVDAMIETLRAKYAIDDNRIYATGFSNGGFFCYLLWAERPQTIAAVAPGAASLVPSIRLKTPKSAFIYGGRNDRLVQFNNQQAAMAAALEVNGCEKKGVACEAHCNLFNSTRQAPVMIFIHEGGHTFVPEIRSLIVEFFRTHPKTANG